METYLFWIVPIASLLALVLAWYFYKQMMLESEGTPTMEKIASYVRQGAMSYLKQQYKVVRAEAYVAVFIPKKPDSPEKKPPVRKAMGTHGFCKLKPYAMIENRKTNPRNTSPTTLYCCFR